MLNGGAACRELTERAANGELTSEEYYAEVIKKYGREKVTRAMDRALTENITTPLSVNAAPIQPTTDDHAIQEDYTKPAELTQSAEHVPTAPPAPVKNSTYKTSIKGLCIPCMRTVTALLESVTMWYDKEDLKKIQTEITRMNKGQCDVEEAVKEILMLDGGGDCINSVLNDVNRVLTLATDIAVQEKPEIAGIIEEENEEL